MNRLILTLFCSMLLPGLLSAQDPVFSQFYAAPLQINPAFAGTSFAPRVSLNYRSQWAEYEGGYKTYSVAYEQSLEELNSGFGVVVMGDDAGNGIYQTNRFHAIYSYRVRIDRSRAIRFGVEAGMIQSGLDWNRLVFLDQIDPVNGPTGPGGGPNPSDELRPASLNNTLLDIGAGLMYSSDQAYAGLSLKHLNSPDESLLDINNNLGVGMPLRITLHGGFEIPLLAGNNRQNSAFLSPNILLVKQGEFAQVNGGAYFGAGSFFGGVWYRHTISNSDAAIALVGVRYGVFRFGYSFDMTLNGLSLGRTGGTHELSLMFSFEDSKEAKRQQNRDNYNNCFKMFN